MHCWHNDLVQTCNFFESVKRFYYERVFRQKVNIYSSIDRVNNPERFHYITSNSAFQRLPFCSFAFLCRYFNVALLGMISFVVPFLLFLSIYTGTHSHCHLQFTLALNWLCILYGRRVIWLLFFGVSIISYDFIRNFNRCMALIAIKPRRLLK